MESKTQHNLIKSEPIIIKNTQKPEINDSKLITKSESQLLSFENIRYKNSDLFYSANNPSIDTEFNKASLIYNKNSISSQEYNESYQENYHQKTYLYNFKIGESRTNFIIFDKETKREELKILETPEPLDLNTSIAQLPNGEIFCYGKSSPLSGITLIIDNNYKVRMLPSGTPCSLTSAIYFENCIYCFGGDINSKTLTISSKFDFVKNRWIKLTSMPKLNRAPGMFGVQLIVDYLCNCVIFDRKILISGYLNEYLLLYSIDIDSFSTIPYKFREDRVKILMHIEERLYLIECWNYGSIYESEIASCDNWIKIRESNNDFPLINFHHPKVYYKYNKGKFYIVCSEGYNVVEYYEFNLDDKVLKDIVVDKIYI